MKEFDYDVINHLTRFTKINIFIKIIIIERVRLL